MRPQSGDGRMRHRDRAAVAGFDLAHQGEERRPRDVRSFALIAPRQRVQAVFDARPEQGVPRRVELDLVDPIAEAIVGAQPRRVFVRLPTPLERLARQQRAERGHTLSRPTRAVAVESLRERAVLEEEVVPDERRRLVQGVASLAPT